MLRFSRIPRSKVFFPRYQIRSYCDHTKFDLSDSDSDIKTDTAESAETDFDSKIFSKKAFEGLPDELNEFQDLDHVFKKYSSSIKKAAKEKDLTAYPPKYFKQLPKANKLPFNEKLAQLGQGSVFEETIGNPFNDYTLDNDLHKRFKRIPSADSEDDSPTENNQGDNSLSMEDGLYAKEKSIFGETSVEESDGGQAGEYINISSDEEFSRKSNEDDPIFKKPKQVEDGSNEIDFKSTTVREALDILYPESEQSSSELELMEQINELGEPFAAPPPGTLPEEHAKADEMTKDALLNSLAQESEISESSDSAFEDLRGDNENTKDYEKEIVEHSFAEFKTNDTLKLTHDDSPKYKVPNGPKTKRVIKNDEFSSPYIKKESMFWTEVLQRGRKVASDFGLDIQYCESNRMSGLTFVEWFGFMDKYYSEAAMFGEDTGVTYSTTSIEKLGFVEDTERDSRFRKRTGRNLASLYPHFEQAMKNSKLNEHIELKRDPRVIAASLREFIQNTTAPNITGPNYANRMRVKPTSVQEDYLAKLLTKLSSLEMKQVIEKKLYQDEPPEVNDDKFAEDMVSETLLEVINNQDYIVSPSFSLPQEIFPPNLHDEIERALESDSDDKQLFTDPEESGDATEIDNEIIAKPKKRPSSCRICSGMHLEPMNGPLLLQLVDDCGFILPKRETGFCGKHQRKISGVLARSIAMGVLDWKEGAVKYLDPFSPEIYPGEVATPAEIKKGGTRNK